MYYVRSPELTIVGSSPEPMVQLRAGTVISRPIAGTRKRGTSDEHDRRLAAELIEHPKERAEHVMLVDLARNDVGRVAQFGTVHVDELMTLERYSHVMHLTSQVSGTLRRRSRPDRRAAGNAAGGHGERCAEGAGDGDHRRARAGEARSLRRRGGLSRLERQPRHRDRHPHDVRQRPTAPACRPVPASSPTPTPTTRTSSATTRPPRCSSAIPAARRMTQARRGV